MRTLIKLVGIVLVVVVLGGSWYNSGNRAGRVAGSPDAYFQNQDLTVSTTYYQELDFGFYSIGISLMNDSTGYFEWSFDGVNTKGVLLTTETFTMNNKTEDDIWFRSDTDGLAWRIIAW